MATDEYIIGTEDKTLYQFIQEQLKDIDTTDLTDEIDNTIEVKIDPSKVYFWTRVYLRDENPNLEIGDEVLITYLPSGETLKTQLITWGKRGLEKDHNDEIINATLSDDKKIICLMVDEKIVNEDDSIPFIRTLFRLSRHYEEQLIRNDELEFKIERNGILLDYYDCDF